MKKANKAVSGFFVVIIILLAISGISYSVAPIPATPTIVIFGQIIKNSADTLESSSIAISDTTSTRSFNVFAVDSTSFKVLFQTSFLGIWAPPVVAATYALPYGGIKRLSITNDSLQRVLLADGPVLSAADSAAVYSMKGLTNYWQSRVRIVPQATGNSVNNNATITVSYE